VVEINPEPTSLTATVTDIHLRGSASEVLRLLLERLQEPAVPPNAH
jgi:hypothetical protein